MNIIVEDYLRRIDKNSEMISDRGYFIYSSTAKQLIKEAIENEQFKKTAPTVAPRKEKNGEARYFIREKLLKLDIDECIKITKGEWDEVSNGVSFSNWLGQFRRYSDRRDFKPEFNKTLYGWIIRRVK